MAEDRLAGCVLASDPGFEKASPVLIELTVKVRANLEVPLDMSGGPEKLRDAEDRALWVRSRVGGIGLLLLMTAKPLVAPCDGEAAAVVGDLVCMLGTVGSASACVNASQLKKKIAMA